MLPCEGECDVPGFMVRRNLFSMVLDNQKENLFHTKCLIKGGVSSMIIYSMSSVNIASVTFVNYLKLRTTSHPNPYKLQWLNKCGELKVNGQCVIRFKVGNYKDKVVM